MVHQIETVCSLYHVYTMHLK